MADQNKNPAEDNLAESQSVMLPSNAIHQHSGITIEVGNPQVRDDTFSKYVIYTIKGNDANGYFEVMRRYSDFDKLRNVLVAKWPGCYIPPLPPKALNSLETRVVRERRKYLQVFCQKIAEIPYLHYYPAYQEFVRSKVQSLEKVFQPMLKVDYEEVINRYIATFSQLGGREYNQAVVRKIIDFKTFLKKTQGLTENFKKISRAMVKAKNTFYQEFAFLNGLVNAEYEKVVFSQYHTEGESRNVFHNEQSTVLFQHAEKVEEGSKKPSLEYLEEWMKSEAREVEAFLEAIIQKENYEKEKNKAQEKQKSETDELQKVLSGKTTMKAMIMRKNKNEEVSDLEKQIAKHNKDFEDLSRLNDMITLVMAYEEIEKFKSNKMETYYNIVRIAAENELSALVNMRDYWGLVLNNRNIVSLSTGDQ